MKDFLKKVFCVPFNGDIDLVKYLVENNPKPIYEFYGTDDLFPSGRWKNPGESAEISSVMDILKGTGIKFNYLLNSVVFDDYIIQREKLKRHLAKLRDAGVSSVTCTTPFIIDMVKSLGFEVNTSLMQNIRSATAVAYYEKLGYDRILLCEDDLRNTRLIRDMASSTELPIEAIIDNVCLMECPFRQTHLSSEGIRHPDFPDSMRQYMSAYCRQCKQFWHYDPANFLKTSWVRPNDLEKLLNCGVKLFKMGGRGIETSAIIQKLSIYSCGEYDGDIFAYLKPHMNSREFLGISSINNNDVEEYFKFFMDGKCTKLCHSCGHCDKWAKKLVEMHKEHWRNRTITGGVGEILDNEDCLEQFGKLEKPNSGLFGTDGNKR